MAKNSGKTVALNQLIAETMEENITIGLISTGRDGEAEDIGSKTESMLPLLQNYYLYRRLL